MEETVQSISLKWTELLGDDSTDNWPISTFMSFISAVADRSMTDHTSGANNKTSCSMMFSDVSELLTLCITRLFTVDVVVILN